MRAIAHIAFSPDGHQLVAVNWGDGSRTDLVVWNLERPGAEPLVLKAWESGGLTAAFMPDDDPISLLIATKTWAHQVRLDGTNLVPHASRLLPGDFPYLSNSPFGFLDQTGERVQILIRPDLNTASPITVRFDEFDASPIEGDPEQLLREWQKKLALRISDKGEIIEAE
jgi:hypothetical protein